MRTPITPRIRKKTSSYACQSCNTNQYHQCRFRARCGHNPVTHPVVCDLEQHQLPTPERIEKLERHSSDHGAEKAVMFAPRKVISLVRELVGRTYLRHITFAGKKYDTSSRLKRTPPIGAPNATATPAAHAALRISRRFAGGREVHYHQKRRSARQDEGHHLHWSRTCGST